MVPFALVGAWNKNNKDDQSVLSLLAGEQDFSTLESQIKEILHIEGETPLWSYGQVQGVISKKDALFALADTITSKDLEFFYTIAQIVLSEDDPALDLPEDKRNFAALYDKKRNFSGELRKGIAETLILLSVYGEDHFETNDKFKTEKLIKDILTPLNVRKLQANDRELPIYAEAAPKRFLQIIEDDLASETPVLLELLKPVRNPIMNDNYRCGLLWALEGLAWNPQTFNRSVNILAQLAEVELVDNLTNKPINSLFSIFRYWMPQTAADAEMRLNGIGRLIDHYPQTGWKIAMQQMHVDGSDIGTYSYKFKWRNDAYGAGGPIDNQKERFDFLKKLQQIIINKTNYTTDQICDFIKRMELFSTAHKSLIVDSIKHWYQGEPTDNELAKVQQAILEHIDWDKFCDVKVAGEKKLLAKAKKVFKDIVPHDPIYQHQWLFQNIWMSPNVTKNLDDLNDYEAREKENRDLRINALKDIVTKKGEEGLLELLLLGNTAYMIGNLSSQDVLTEEQIESLVKKYLQSIEENKRNQSFISGLLNGLSKESFKKLYSSISRLNDDNLLLKFFLIAPFNMTTWQLIEEKNDEENKLHNEYWKKVVPFYIPNSTEENIQAAQYLVDANRAKAAFSVVYLILKDVPIDLLYTMLNQIAKMNDETTQYHEMDAYNIRKAFKILDQSHEIAFEKKAELEFLFIDSLARRFVGDKDHQIPNLERMIEINPMWYIQAIAFAFKRNDGG